MSTEAAHTPIFQSGLTYGPSRAFEGQFEVLMKTGGFVCRVRTEDEAREIVRACNSHAALVEEHEAAKALLEIPEVRRAAALWATDELVRFRESQHAAALQLAKEGR